MKKQIQFNLGNIETEETHFQQIVVEPILSGDDVMVKQGIINLNTLILKTAADFAGFKDRYSDFKIIAVSAWEHDETHVRHLSCESEFRVKTAEAPHWVMETRGSGTNHMRARYKKGSKWQPGYQSPVATSNDDKIWNESTIDRLLDYSVKTLTTYYLGKPPCNVGAGVDFRGQTPPKTKQDIRYAVSAAAGLLYGLDSFIYSVVDIKGETGFNSEGSVIKMSLNSEATDYNIQYLGDAYITEPQLVIRASGYQDLGENIYI